MTALGQRLIDAAKLSRREVVLIAPFMKADALAAILENVSDPSISITVVARWIPVEIVAGVCDLEIFDVVSSRQNATLYIHPLLHAKLYRFDDFILIGSANVTRRALGWTAPANVEILAGPNEPHADIRALEKSILSASILVDAALRDSVLQKVEALKVSPPSLAEVFEPETREVVRTWLPTCRAPDRLWNVYAGFETWRLVEAAANAAKDDLAALNIPTGLSKDQFREFVTATLERMPLVQEIETATQNGLTPEAAAALISEATGSNDLPYSSIEMWEVLQAWLIYFFPGRYRREPSSELFRRGRIIG
jgi:hypothetical protein